MNRERAEVWILFAVLILIGVGWMLDRAKYAVLNAWDDATAWFRRHRGQMYLLAGIALVVAVVAVA